MFDGRRVLVVDDEFLAGLTAIDFLESIGCEVVGPAARLSDAVDLARSENLDAALLDINLADEMVWPVAEVLRLKHVPFIFLSAFSQSNLPSPSPTLRLSRSLWTRFVFSVISTRYGTRLRSTERSNRRPGTYSGSIPAAFIMSR